MADIRRILVATDFSDYSKEAIDYAVYMGKNFKADLYLLHVFEPAYISPGGVILSVVPDEVHTWIKQIREDSNQKLNFLSEEIRKEISRVESRMMTGTAFEAILKFSEEIPADLIVLGTHGRTGMAHVFIGSVAERVVRKAQCPVLTVRPTKFKS